MTVGLLGAPPAGGQDAAPVPPAAAATDPLAPVPLDLAPLFGSDDDPLSPALARVASGSSEQWDAIAVHDATAAQLTTTIDTLNLASARLHLLLTKDGRVQEHLHAARDRERDTRRVLRRHESVLAALAIDTFTQGNDRTLDLIDPDAANLAQRDRGLTRAVTSHQATLLVRTREQVADARAEVGLAAERIRSLRNQQRITAGTRTKARNDAFLLSAQLNEQRIAAQRARAEATVTRLDLSMVALDAYVIATHRMNTERPACRLSWPVLAGIGSVESRHGTYRGADLRWDGATDPRIIGVALTGAGGVAYVGDSDGGALDGDPSHDRAVGPMQFIPSSWRIFGRDGNGDDVEDPHNIYDAALGAAEHLCRRYTALDTPEGLKAALLSYNRSVPYGERVMSLAAQYAAANVPLGRTFRPLNPATDS